MSGDSLPDYQIHANALKDEGNEAFRKGDTQRAVECYTQAISLNPDDHVFYSNRSAAYMKLDSISKALKDGEMCLKLAPNWGKGYNRLGVAQQGLKRYDAALVTFRHGLELEPSSSALQAALKECEAMMERNMRDAEAAIAAEEQRQQREEEEREERRRGQQQQQEAEAGGADDPLAGFLSEVSQETERAQQERQQRLLEARKEVMFHEKYQNQDLGSGKAQHQRLTAPNYEWRNLNPYYVLQLGTDATEEDIKHRYRKLSAKVHPDKNRGIENARDSFEEVKKAYVSIYIYSLALPFFSCL